MEWNIIMGIGIVIMIIGFLLFIWCEMEIAEADRKLFRQEQLTKSFDREKIKKINYKKVKEHFWKKIEQDGLNLSRKKYK